MFIWLLLNTMTHLCQIMINKRCLIAADATGKIFSAHRKAAEQIESLFLDAKYSERRDESHKNHLISRYSVSRCGIMLLDISFSLLSASPKYDVIRT